MKYKIEKGMELFDQLLAVKQEMARCFKAAGDWVREKYGDRKIYGNGSVLAGGIAGIGFDEKPDGWMSVGAKWQKVFYPKASNRALIQEIKALPVVREEAIKSILNYGSYAGASGGGLAWSSIPTVAWHPDYILVGVPNFAKTYVPVDGMVEILESEYVKLMNEIEKLAAQ